MIIRSCIFACYLCCASCVCAQVLTPSLDARQVAIGEMDIATGGGTPFPNPAIVGDGHSSGITASYRSNYFQFDPWTFYAVAGVVQLDTRNCIGFWREQQDLWYEQVLRGQGNGPDPFWLLSQTGITYQRRVIDSFSVGASVKYFEQVFRWGEFTSHGMEDNSKHFWALLADVGMHYGVCCYADSDYSIGASCSVAINNFGTWVNNSVSEPGAREIPRTYCLGIALKTMFPVADDQHGISFEFGWHYEGSFGSFNETTGVGIPQVRSWNVGAECSWLDLIFLRASLQDRFQDSEFGGRDTLHPVFGFGAALPLAMIDARCKSLKILFDAATAPSQQVDYPTGKKTQTWLFTVRMLYDLGL